MEVKLEISGEKGLWQKQPRTDVIECACCIWQVITMSTSNSIVISTKARDPMTSLLSAKGITVVSKSSDGMKPVKYIIASRVSSV